jgi:CMP-N-acetylneuraminic acid synthetase
MYRRKCYDAIGGYNENIRYQEDYDFWIKFIEKFQVRNVSLPLTYYRQHGSSMSRNFGARMRTRRAVKAKFVHDNRDRFRHRVVAIIPARKDYLDGHKMALLPFGERTVLHDCIKKLAQVEMVGRIIVSTDDPEIMAVAEEAGGEVPYLRSRASTGPSAPFESALLELLGWLRENEGCEYDMLVICHPHSPFITADHITEAIDTLLLYDTDSVIGVVEDLTYHWQVGRNGLMPVGYQKRVVRQEKDLIYKEAGGIYAIKTAPFLAGGELLGKSIGHIELAPHEALRILTPYDYWVARRIADSQDPWLGS